MKAHDVRHLSVCPGCQGLADVRETVNPMHICEWTNSKWHPKCYFEKFGKQDVIERLPRSEQDKFRLCDIPAGVMKTLLRLRENAPSPQTAERQP